MNKGIIAVIGALIVASVAVVGAMVYAKSKIQSEIELALANAEQSPIFTSLKPGDITVDLLGDRVILRNAQATIDLSEVAKSYAEQMPKGMTMTGTASQTYLLVSLSGVRGLIFGDTKIAALTASGGMQTYNLTQTILKANSNLSIAHQGVGTIGRISAQDIDLATMLSMPLTPSPFNATVKSVQVDDIKLDFTLQSEVSPPAQTAPPALKGTYSVASLSIDDMTPEHIANVVMKNTRVTMTPPKPGASPIDFTINEVSATDVRMTDLSVTAGDFAISGMTFPLPKTTDPKAQMVLTLLGMSDIRLDFRTKFTLDEAANTLSLAPVKVRLHKIGAVDVSVDVSGVPPMADLQKLQDKAFAIAAQTDGNTDPLWAQEQKFAINAEYKKLLENLAVSTVEVGYKDEGALKTFLAAQAMKAKADMNTLAQAYALQASAIIQATHGPETATAVRATLANFLANPGELRVRLSANEPVNVKQLQAMFKVMGPAALNAFKLDVSAP